MLHLAVDIGVTFTDICVFDEESDTMKVGKVSSTRDPIDAVFEGIEEVGVTPDEIGLFSHGTTVATNALITRKFPRSAMVTTQGFRDVIEILKESGFGREGGEYGIEEYLDVKLVSMGDVNK